MTTKIYKSYNDFVNRENRLENGVSESFAADYPNYAELNETNEYCWNCSNCSDCSDCRGCRGCSDCRGCSYCSYCSGCSDCSYCSGCSDCRDCSGCSGKNWEDDKVGEIKQPKNGESKQEFATFAGLKIPIIPNIHQRILEAVTNSSHTLNMSAWHDNVCGTTHCRAGWVTTLAGEEGRKLELASDTCFAAMMIYKYSSPEIRVSPNRFFEDNATAMRDIEYCAELEAKKGTNL